ncbi:MAG: YihY family inner membrane protein [Desulfovibrionales bacterium]|nr:YihY family inner membrane protein [Desulfovibrionales bacterium]
MIRSSGRRTATTLRRFVTHTVWDPLPADASVWKRAVIVLCRRLAVIYNGFLQDNTMLRASALAYTTVLSIVPFLAVVFAVSKGLGVQNSQTLRFILLNMFAGNVEAVDFLLQYVNNTDVTALGVVGVATLLITVVSLMGNIEAAFNKIWNVRKGRTLWRKFTDFFSIVLVAPLLLGFAVSLSVTMQHDALVQTLLKIDAVSYVYFQFLKILPTVVIWFLLTFSYAFIPNTKVSARSALAGGLVGVMLWKSVEEIYLSYLVGVNNYNVIYGSFAQLPLFLIWIYLSWLIVLFGVQICYAVQYGATEEDKLLAGKTSTYEKATLAIAVMQELAKSYTAQQGAVSVAVLSESMQLSQVLIDTVLRIMEQAGLVAKIEQEDAAYILSRPAASVRVSDIIIAMTTFRPAQGAVHSVAGHATAVAAMDESFAKLKSGTDCSLDEL